MSFLRKLFGGGGSSEPKAADVVETAEHKGFSIAATPMAEGGQYRLAATITKTVNGEDKSYTLIRADVFQSPDQAAEFAIRKARLVIDEQGERLFA